MKFIEASVFTTVKNEATKESANIWIQQIINIDKVIGIAKYQDEDEMFRLSLDNSSILTIRCKPADLYKIFDVNVLADPSRAIPIESASKPKKKAKK